MSQQVELSEVKADLKDIESASASPEDACKIVEHEWDHEKIQKELGVVFSKGLTSVDAAERLEKFGRNALTPKEPVWWVWKALAHILGGFSLLLWAGSILCFAVYGIDGSIENLTLGSVLAIVVSATGVFSYYQEVKSDNVLEALLKLAPTACSVLRDGEWTHLDAALLVVGDVIKIQNGNKVPADVVIIESAGIKVDNSSLTGEAEPLKRIPACTDPMPTRTKNVAFFGTACVEGAGTGVVVKTGDQTTMGDIAKSVQETEKPQALMKYEIERFVHIISGIALSIGIIFLVLSIIMGYEPLDAIIFTIGIIVANVPEGLLATVTVALTITAERMSKKNVLVKSTLIIETLGSVTAIASDKTGTLTQNRMSVRNAIYPDGTVRVTKHPKRRSIKDKLETLTLDESDKAFKAFSDMLIENAGLCNHAHFEGRDMEILQRTTDGDASESALLKFCHSNGDSDALREKYPEISCVPFNSTNKFMITMHTIPNNKNDYRLCIKGAPERVMDRCSNYTDTKDGKVKSLTAAVKNNITEANTKLARNGERVLAFGEQIVKGLGENFNFETDDIRKTNFPMDGFLFTGMLSLEDPPREQVPAAVAACHDASITVIMVTGDHPLTARSIAAQIGILTEKDGGQDAPIYDITAPAEKRNNKAESGIVVTGDILDKLTQDDWDYVLTRTGIVFARTLPTQKQDIVERLQKPLEEGGLDHVVSVTGDGVNDSPALKAARVGIAMGSGAEVAKEASDLILIDDDFSSIVKGIEEGRLIFANLKKSIAYTLTSNIPEIIPFIAQIVLKIPLGLTTIMILCIDLGTDILPAISFAYEESESDIMNIPPRDRHNDKLVTATLISFSYIQIGIIQASCAFTVFFNCLARHGFAGDWIIESELGFEWIDEKSTSCFENSNVAVATSGIHQGKRCANYEERMFSLRTAQAAFLTSIVICQIACGLACKTRLTSLFTHGMKNMVFNYGLVQETVLIVMLVYIPGLQTAFGTENIEGEDWAIAIPFACFILFYDEMRKYFMRQDPDGDFKKYMYY